MQQQFPQHPHRCATVVNSVVSSDAESYDELNPKDKAQAARLIPQKEQILYAGAVKKINKRLIPQNRILIITDKALYNIQPKEDFFATLAFSIIPSTAVKRKIDIKKIFAITLSVKATDDSEQFVIHVNGEYDYRYDAGPKCEKILKSIMNAYFKHYKVPFILYLRDEKDLASFHTTDDDLKASIDKRPKEGKIFVTPEIMAKGLAWVVNNRKALLQQTNVFYSIPSDPVISNPVAQSEAQGQGQYNNIDFVQSQAQPQNQFNSGNSYLADNNMQRNPLHRAQSVGQENRPIYDAPIPSVQPQLNNVQLNFSGSVQQQPPVLQHTNSYQAQSQNQRYEQASVPQYDFLQKDLVSTSANYNVKITTNFEDSMTQGQRTMNYA